MTKRYLAWVHKIVPNACSLYHFEGFDKSYLLHEGIELANKFPDDVYFDMHPDRPHDTLLVDSLFNTDKERVISESLKKFLVAKKSPNLEFLPVKIMDHKGKFIEDKYFIMNVLDHQNCLDYDASEAEISLINDKTIDSVEQIVLLDEKVNDNFDIFRICDFPSATLVSESLAKELEDNGFTGIEFLPLDEFD
ncbi:MAG: DUF1629 domain-containing protein [Paraglaciecola sp.]|uniref:Imm43 family immunity protein n=1 Tax=Paraglaciecola sp. TaxID=1920173 RepID=UPI0032979581